MKFPGGSRGNEMAQTKTRQEKQIEIKEEKRMDLQALGMVETKIGRAHV